MLNRSSRVIAISLVCCLLVGARAETAATPDDLPPKYRAWLEEVALIITDEEREAFLELEEDYQRDAFIERFWSARDLYPGGSRNTFRERWEQRVSEARARFESLSDKRAEVLLLNGPPTALIEPRCRSVLVPMEIWFYEGSERVRETFAVIFYRQWGAGPYRIWHPFDGPAALVRQASAAVDTRNPMRAIDSCPMADRDPVVAALRLAQARGSTEYELLLSRISTPEQEAMGGEWLSAFAAYSTEVPPDAGLFDATFEIQFPGRRQQRTLVQGVLTVADDEVEPMRLGESATYDFVLTGEIMLEERLFENFRYQFQISESEVTDGRIPLVFERALRPGSYDLRLRLQTASGDSYFRADRTLDVPTMDGPATPVPPNPEMAKLFEEANRHILSGDTSIRIVPPRNGLLTGPERFDTLITGPGIASVAFILDGTTVLRKRQAPYSVELDLGELPRLRELLVEAYDEGGAVVARDQTLLNAGAHRFSVHLVEPRPGSQHQSSLRAVAKVTAPEGESVERVDFFLDETPVASLYQPPWEQPIRLREPGQAGYVRVVAHQADGSTAEDLAFINAPGVTGRVGVQFVELYVTVTDRERRPVLGLEIESFRIQEDGVLQEPVRFDRVDNLPIQALLMVDTSGSMEPHMERAQQAALGFVEAAIGPADRAAILAFNDYPELRVRLTPDHRQLAAGLAGLRAERGTALWDSLITALYHMNGVSGQRALILLSDGDDEGSRFSAEDAVEYARRSGVTIYVVGLGFEQRSLRQARRQMQRLAAETGGEFVPVSSSAELPEIYRRIQEELRSRYYIGYQSTNTSDEDRFRRVDVEVDVRGAEVSTMRGYYP